MAEDVGNIGGLLTPRENLIPNIQSAYGAIIQNAPEYQYFTAPLSNQGRTTASYGRGNNIVVAPDTGIRLVNNATGEVIFSGSGYGGAQQAIDAATALSSSAGGKANWDIQITRPGSTNFETVSTERPDDVVGKIAGLAADIGLPVLASAIVPGAGFLGTVLPAAGGSALSSVAQGRSLQDTLLRAGLAGAGAGLGEAIFTPGVDALGNSISNTASNAINTAYQAAQQGAGSALGSVYGSTIGSSLGSAAGSAAGAAGAGLVDDIIVNAMRKAGPSFLNSVGGSLASSVVPSFFDSAQLETMQMDGGAKADTNTATDGGELIITGRQPTNILPSTIGGTAVSQVLSEAAKANAEGATNSQNDRITPTAAETAALNAGAGGKGFLGTGLSATQLATLGSLGASAVGSLFGGSGGTTGTGTPYVSPFGVGGTMAGGDFRANPNIQNYEQYGFGGEASFFRPEYYNLVSSGSKMGYTPPAGTTAPTYTPLIGGNTNGTMSQPVMNTGPSEAITSPVTKQVRPEGWTGVVSGQQVGDTQVVDGTTWQWGGDNVGWQMQYKNPETGNIGVLPGNGATNVSSFKNNPTVAVNQPYFAQNTANIPGWATTYQGFQQGLMGAGITGAAKAAAERELFSAIETQPFANATALVDYAKGIYNKYTSPDPTSLLGSPNQQTSGGMINLPRAKYTEQDIGLPSSAQQQLRGLLG